MKRKRKRNKPYAPFTLCPCEQDCGLDCEQRAGHNVNTTFTAVAACRHVGVHILLTGQLTAAHCKLSWLPWRMLKSSCHQHSVF